MSSSRSFLLGFVACLFLLGGTAVAANLITGKQIKDGSITGIDVKNKSLTPKDFRGSTASLRGPAGPSGPAGPQGPPGSPGNGVQIKDANGALIGELIDDPSVASLGGPTVVTPGGYALTIGWDGSLPPKPFVIYALSNCQGTAYLGTGAGSQTVTTSTKRLIYESAPGTFQVPARPTSALTGVASYEEASASCTNTNSITYAWPLRAVSRAATGLPSTIVGPIELATG